MVFRAGSDLKKGRIMHKTAIVIGLLLIGNGVYGYTGGEVVSVTALIPAFVGAVILLCGIGAGLKPGRVNMRRWSVPLLSHASLPPCCNASRVNSAPVAEGAPL